MAEIGHRLEKDGRADFLCGGEHHLPVGAMQVLVGMKSQHSPPAVHGKGAGCLRRAQPQMLEVVMDRQAHSLQSAADIPGPDPIIQLHDAGMDARIIRAVDRLRLFLLVRLPDILNSQGGQQKPFCPKYPPSCQAFNNNFSTLTSSAISRQLLS